MRPAPLRETLKRLSNVSLLRVSEDEPKALVVRLLARQGTSGPIAICNAEGLVIAHASF